MHFKPFKSLIVSKYNFSERKPLKLIKFFGRKILSFGHFKFFERRLRILNRADQKHYSKYFNSSFLKLRILPSFKSSFTLFSKLILVDRINQKLNILRKRDYKVFFKKFLFLLYTFKKTKFVKFLTSFSSFFRGSFLLKSFLVVLKKNYFKKSSKVNTLPLFFIKRSAIKYFSYFIKKQSVSLSSFRNSEHFSNVSKRFRNFFIVSRKFLKKKPSWFSFSSFSKHSFSYFQYHFYNYSYKNGLFRNHHLLSKSDQNNKLRFFFKIFYYPRAFAGLGLFSNF